MSDVEAKPTTSDKTGGAPALPRLDLLYYFIRMQFPMLALTRAQFDKHIARSFQTYAAKTEDPLSWNSFCDGLYALDWTVSVGCLEGQNAAWELLFSARTGRSDCLLIDALRSRAARLYPRSEEKRETAVSEFWSHLLVPDAEGSVPVLARYDGQRPLAPWLIRVFQNRHLSKLRLNPGPQALPDDDLTVPLPTPPKEEIRWHEAFVLAAQDWLMDLSDQERLLLGLRWRYKLSQRDVANRFGVHEGTISRQTDKLRDHALAFIGERLQSEGWTGDDLEAFIFSELGAVLTDDPRLSADALARLLGQRTPAVSA